MWDLTLRPDGALVGDDKVVYEDLGVAFFHGGHDGLEDLRVDFVVPVLDDGMEVVCASAWFGGLAKSSVRR